MTRKAVRHSVNNNGTELEQIVSHTSNIVPEQLAEGGFGSKSQSSVDFSPRSYLLTSATVRIPFFHSSKRGTEHSTFFISSAQLSSITEIAPKKPFLCVNRNPIRYCFRAGPRTILCCMQSLSFQQRIGNFSRLPNTTFQFQSFSYAYSTAQ